MNELVATFHPVEIEVTIGDDIPTIETSFSAPVLREYLDIDHYEGQYVITPSNQRIELNTQNKKMMQNLVINPIPRNYGRIIWNGSFIKII